MTPKQRKLIFWSMTGFALLLFLFFNHNDIAETAQHAWNLIRSIADGQFLSFYDNVANRVYDFGFGFVYLNNAHYNILIYLLLALWELPLYLLCALLGLSGASIEFFLYFWVKALCAGVFVLCAPVVERLALRLGLEKKSADDIRLFFLFCPISLFVVFQFGGYDMFCLLFILLALEAMMDRRLLRFSLLIGVASVFKFFAFLPFIPLLLLCEKRIAHVIRLGLCSLWITLPTTLLFWGRATHSAAFNASMVDRFFFLNIPTEYGEISVFLLLYAALCVFCFACPTPARDRLPALSLYLCALSFGLLFLTITWHPQWMILLLPFLLLCAAQSANRRVLFWVGAVFCLGYFLNMTFMFPGALDANLLRLGVLHASIGETGSLAALLQKLPLVRKLAPAAYAASLMSLLVLLAPYKGRPLCDRLEKNGLSAAYTPARCFRGLFFLGYCLSWLLPAAAAGFLF